ncbi:MAG: prolipoprotein diacylglyceryl transferase [Clostridiales bacterium]|jgi:phosphatidylglycerol:prolipoprotein diacylglycerol transferase|nr:prolipoprotein diacylglyceryl transferase [Clostridiales bacterium]
MKFLADYTAVTFTGIDKVFDVPGVFVRFTMPFVGSTVTIRWYGLLIFLGFTLAVLFGGRMAYKWKMDLNKMLDVLIYGTFGGIIGARIYYVLFDWGSYKDDLLSVFKLWEGGLAIYGGLIGGLIAAYITCKFNKLNFYNLLDLAGMSFLIGQGIGRWGNFTNQEAFGTNSDLPLGMWSEKVADYLYKNQAAFLEQGIVVDPMKPVHPTFLYESVWCLLGFLVLYIVCKKARKFSGQIILMYGVWYGAGRFVFEGLRTDSLYIWNTNIRMSQLLSLLLVLFCLVLLIVKLIKYTKHPVPIEGVDFFPDEEKKNEANTVSKATAEAESGSEIEDTTEAEDSTETQTAEENKDSE